MKKKIGIISFLVLLATAIFISPNVSLGQEEGLNEELIRADEPVAVISALGDAQNASTTNTIQLRISPATIIGENGQVLEKIPSPDQIKNFRVIKKENGSLYGVRLQSMTANQAQSQNQNKVQANIQSNTQTQTGASSVSGKLEKIPAPQFIKDYEKIQQIGSALWGVKKVNANANANANRYRVVGADIKTCVSSAITAKDSALKEKLIANNTDLSNLIEARQACQLIALESADGQGDKINACNRDFQAKHQNMIKTMKESQARIWTTYKNSLGACLPQSAREIGEVILIEDGGSNTLESSSAL